MMKRIKIVLVLFLMNNCSFGQKLISGTYDYAINLAFDEKNNRLTGFFEDATGWNEQLKAPMFYCSFYMEGTIIGKLFKIGTYYPEDKSTDFIEGTIEIIDDKTIKIKLDNEHGGCWNVEHFADQPVTTNLIQSQNWIQIRYVVSNKAFFYTGKNGNKIPKLYVIKNDFVCVDKIEGEWVHAVYVGEKKSTKGWLKAEDLNQLR